MKLLTNCRDDFEAQMVEGLLESADIPVHKKYQGTGHALKIYGGVGQNVDIYVPRDRWQEAKLLLESSHEFKE